MNCFPEQDVGHVLAIMGVRVEVRVGDRKQDVLNKILNTFSDQSRPVDIMVSYTIAHEAYLKVIFHAAKHPHLPVNGVLLGKNSSSDKVFIEDAIPLLHHWTSLSPMMEISLDLVSSFGGFTRGSIT